MYLIQGFIYFTILLSVKTVMSDKMGFCNPHEIKLQIETNCTNCHINVFVDCPMGTQKLTKMEGNAGCEYTQHLGPGHDITNDGCTHTCEQTMQAYNCCTGYWGPQCDDCPGGHESPCSGHGICNDTLIGTGLCTCDAGWLGYSCEFCVDPAVGGEHCNEHIFEPSFDLCRNVTCPNNSRCISIDDEVICICTWPYVEHDEESDKNTTEIVCKELDTCTVPPLCHHNATCEKSSIAHTSGIDKNCSCNHGYTGDGYQCDAIDPCQTDNGGCDEVTSSCVYVDAGKSECECRHGFENNILTDGCSLIDVCSSSNSTCDPKASCLTVAPYQTTCQCPDGYAGDGHNCYGNIVQKIKDLNEFDPDLNGTLKFIQQAIEKYYYTELTEHGPFTMFVPVDDGFRNIDNPDFQEWLKDEVRTRQILRQHIVVGEFMASNLTDVTFYTLQGSAAVLKVNWKDEYRFRIHGANRKGKTMRRDIIATNGIIHIISKLMINDADIQVFHKANVYQNLMLDRYSTFKQLVDSCGTEISDILQNDNVTLFAPSNPHFDELPTELIDHLKSLKGGEELKEVLMNHIFPGKIEITDLINIETITSLLNMTNGISVSSTGQVLLNGRVEITQADMPATNGLMHDIHGLLITSTMNVYPSRCDNDTKGQGQGCCAGFYGPDCLLCPGGFTNPCHGHGTCDDGISGSGNCTCKEPFTGWNCKSCMHNYWGQDCQGTCDCVRGECIETYYKGYGECKCDDGVHGTNCDRQDIYCQNIVSNPWSFLRSFTCHIHAQCIVFSDNTYRCVCKPGYQGAGDACTEIDPCETNRGGCHLQATCRKTGPGGAECQCNNGFKGDGHFCYLETECRMHTDCHQNARCMSTARGQYVCQCSDGFYGNGTSCWYDDKCKINNGGCHSHAKCIHGDRFNDNVTCTCYTELGFYGDGYHCRPSIMRIIQEDPRLTKMAEMMKKLKESSIKLDIWESGEHTVFAWTDRAVEQAQIELLKAQGGDLGTRHILTLLKAHTVQGRHSLDYLAAVSSVTQLHSLLDGFSFFVTKDNGTFSAMLRRTGRVTTVESHDLEASNGYLNIIDEILFPVLDIQDSSTNQDIYAEWKNLTDTHNISWSMKDPTLTGFMEDYPNYSIFMNSLKKKNLTSMLENDDFPFTLFVPSNEYMERVNRTVTRDFLRYYIVPEVRMMWSMSDRDTLMTDLGSNHQLQIQWLKNKPLVNGVPVLKHDIFLSGGMLNLIDGLLHPNLSWCEVDYTHVEMGPCTVCARKLYTCLDGLKPAAYRNALPCLYEERVADEVAWKAGCQGLCVTQKTHRDCCAGHYGDTCQECPGGPELPCSGHGQCNGATTGDGKCMCERSFVGQTCDSCITGFTGPNCNIDMSGCAYKNGGCHKDANCTRGNSDVISCECMKGFSGNGYSCTGPCDDNNGGCHRDATCKYTFQTDMKCKCNAAFVGDGKSYCMTSLYSSLSSLPDAHWFYKSLISMTDKTLVKELNSTTVTHKFTVFVPKDGSLNTMMSEEAVLQQIVMSSEGLVLNPTDFTNVSLYTLSNQSVVVSYDPAQHMFYVNNTKVLSRNIKFTNGIVHIVQQPFTPTTESSKGLPVGAVVGTVICVLLFGLIVAVGIVVYRQSKTGYWSTLNKWLVRRETSSAVDNVPLHMDEEDSNLHDSGLPAATKFDNPAFVTDSE